MKHLSALYPLYPHALRYTKLEFIPQSTQSCTAAFWRTFSDEGKLSPGWWGWVVHAHPLSLHLPSPVKLQCTLQLSGQIHWPSNGNDIETKRSETSIIGVFSISKRNELTYSITGKDRSEANTIIIVLCRIEAITNIISPEFAGSKRKRKWLV
jgi:hypothetical protein